MVRPSTERTLPLGVSVGAEGNVTAKVAGTYLGTFTTIREAGNCYKKYKESKIKQVAEKYVDALEPRVYNALINYRVEISD